MISNLYKNPLANLTISILHPLPYHMPTCTKSHKHHEQTNISCTKRDHHHHHHHHHYQQYHATTEKCLLSNNIHDYHIVAQGKTTIPSVDDGEEMQITDVRIGRWC